MLDTQCVLRAAGCALRGENQTNLNFEIFTPYYDEQSCTAGWSAFITGQSPLRTGLSKVGLPGTDLGLRKEKVNCCSSWMTWESPTTPFRNFRRGTAAAE